MKRSVLVICALLFYTLLSAQTVPIDELFDKYSEKEGFTSVYISGRMMNMLAGLDAKSGNPDNVMTTIKSIRILSQDSASTEKIDFYTELSKKLDFSVYEELMVIKESHEVTKFLIRQEGDIVTELLMVTGGKGGNVLISIRGNLNLKQLSNLSKTLGVEELENLENVEDRKNVK